MYICNNLGVHCNIHSFFCVRKDYVTTFLFDKQQQVIKHKDQRLLFGMPTVSKK
ncbi:hypothetical protein HanHA300_Chr12g0456631 [Helianthus annuus]|nr:hypothetical protein HanHA300_Chr12g0456631 [Helianthus annuus]KAJ0506459.1 hypothetical protein HanHA89_Chr12g0482211 [Helianthus annuus]KAJ0676135.1 hypothetical protein HanLR1_Chr12g0459191 [Helianthus annuus]KAJ0679369.1 hypothetical protein HanOQP8_Chr12g0458611 [Helianthus annuus]